MHLGLNSDISFLGGAQAVRLPGALAVYFQRGFRALHSEFECVPLAVVDEALAFGFFQSAHVALQALSQIDLITFGPGPSLGHGRPVLID